MCSTTFYVNENLFAKLYGEFIFIFLTNSFVTESLVTSSRKYGQPQKD